MREGRTNGKDGLVSLQSCRQKVQLLCKERSPVFDDDTEGTLAMLKGNREKSMSNLAELDSVETGDNCALIRL